MAAGSQPVVVRSLAVRLQGGEHDVGPGKQLRNRGRDIGETLRINHSRLWRPVNANDGRHAVRLDQLHAEVVVVDLGRSQRRNGMIGQGGLLFRSGPVLELISPSGPDLFGLYVRFELALA
jgi:methionine aminopeptidase